MLGEAQRRAARRRPRRAARLRRARARSLGVDVDPRRDTGDSLARRSSSRSRSSRRSGAARSVLILDEPTSMLTPQGVAELEQVLARLKGQGLAVIFITHKLHEAISIGDRVTILSQGRLVGAIGRDELALARRTRSCRTEIVAHHVRRARRPRRADVAELRTSCRVDAGSASARAPSRRPARARRRRRRRRRAELGHRRTSRSTCARARSWASPGVDGNGQRELAEVDRRPAARDRRRRPALRRSDRRSSTCARGRSSGSATSPTTASARASSARWASAINIVPQADRPAAVLASAAASSARAIDREARELVARVRHPHARASRRASATLSGGNIQKVAARARALVRPEGRRLQQADLRPRREDDAAVREHDPRAGRGRRRVARHLHRPRRAARALRPHRRALARAARRHVEQRARRRRARSAS